MSRGEQSCSPSNKRRYVSELSVPILAFCIHLHCYYLVYQYHRSCVAMWCIESSAGSKPIINHVHPLHMYHLNSNWLDYLLRITLMHNFAGWVNHYWNSLLILHSNSEFSRLPNAPGIRAYGIPVLVPCIDFHTHEPRAGPLGLILRVSRSQRGVPRLRLDPESRTALHGTQSENSEFCGNQNQNSESMEKFNTD
eukprot:COSAG02_NODE_1970_length_10224_cov_104.344691_3_plen_195_part_00